MKESFVFALIILVAYATAVGIGIGIDREVAQPKKEKIMSDVIRPEQFIYRDVEYVDNYDGDTIDFIVRKTYDFGFGHKISGELPIRIRLYGVDTYELLL